LAETGDKTRVEGLNLRSGTIIIIALTLMLSLAFASNLADPSNSTSSKTQLNDSTENASLNTLQLGDSANEDIIVYFFWAIGCPHCANTIPYIDSLAAKYPQVTFLKLEVSHNSTNWALYQDFNTRYHVQNQQVPSAFIEDEALIGEDAIKADLESIIVRTINTGPPTAPQNLVATAGNGNVILTWSAPANNGGDAITNYKVYRGTTPGAKNLLTTLSNVLTYTDAGLTNGQTYYYIVSAVNSAGEGAQSIELSVTLVGPPTAPQNLHATPGNTFINLTWQAPASDGNNVITNYEVWRGASTNTETFLADAGTKLWYNNTELSNDQIYYYVVKAENAQGLSLSSNEVSAQPSQTVSVPTAPQNLVATAGNGNVILTWSAPANKGGAAITNYTVYRGTTSGGGTPLTTLDNVLTYTNTGLSNGLTYYYTVSAVNSIGEGTKSNEASATPVDGSVPSAPIKLIATKGDSLVELEWTAPSYSGPGTIIYHLFRNGTEVWNGTVTEHVDLGLVNGVTYSYSVAASNAIGWGPNSSNVQVTPTESGGSDSTELTVITVIVAAAVDSINPCAISVMIFLLLFLTSLGNKRRVLLVGIAYIATVYIVYFMAGLGLLTFLQSMTMTRYVYYAAAVLSIAIGLINIKDYFFPGNKPTVAIPESRKPMIKKYIEKASIPAAVVLGGMVALFELPCTGAIYFAILNLLGDKMTVTEGIPYLALYNGIFVLPLVVILVIILMGVSAERANSWRLENRSILRLVIGLVMVVLGAMMLLGVF
jgi:cytochrome c biogenesis protein CcdA/fibronectin type 3 domain-containing protein